MKMLNRVYDRLLNFALKKKKGINQQGTLHFLGVQFHSIVCVMVLVNRPLN